MDSKNVLLFFWKKLGSTDLLSSSPISSYLIFLEFSLSSKSRKLRCLLEIDNHPNWFDMEILFALVDCTARSRTSMKRPEGIEFPYSNSRKFPGALLFQQIAIMQPL